MNDGWTSRWTSLSTRERGLIGGGMALTAILLSYAWVWEPLRASDHQLRLRVAEQRADLAWMRQASQEIKQLSATGKDATTPDGRSLLTRVDQTARAAGLGSTLKRIAPQGEDKLSAQLDAVAFDQLIPWLGALEREHHLTIVNLSVDRTGAAGRVNARVILQSGQP